LVFITLTVANLNSQKRAKARSQGMIIAICLKISLMFFAYYICHQNKFVLNLFWFEYSINQLAKLLLGGFLVIKSISEIYDIKNHRQFKFINRGYEGKKILSKLCFVNAIMAMDSAAIAVGITDSILIAIVATIISFAIMDVATKKINEYVYSNPIFKIYYLVIIVMLGIVMILNSFSVVINQNYIYFGALLIVTLNYLSSYILRDKKEQIEEKV
jgi:predicted tellurium resistance membrane protein TerC